MSRSLGAVRATLAVAVTIAGILVTPAVAHAASGAVPFSDPNAKGTLTFCDRAGQPMTSGSLYTRPFAWKTVSSVEAPAGYGNSAGRATLFAFQPIQYVDPGGWIGSVVIGASSYTNPSHPVVQATNLDQALLGFVNSYPLHWDGLVQMRMLYAGSNLPDAGGTYPTAVLRVTGNTWTLVSGGGTSCDAGKGVSNATTELPKKWLSTPTNSVPLGSATPAAAEISTNSSASPSATPGASGHPSSAATQSAGQANQVSNSADSSSGGSSGSKAGIGLAIVALLVAAGGAFLWWRRRPTG